MWVLHVLLPWCSNLECHLWQTWWCYKMMKCSQPVALGEYGTKPLLNCVGCIMWALYTSLQLGATEIWGLFVTLYYFAWKYLLQRNTICFLASLNTLPEVTLRYLPWDRGACLFALEREVTVTYKLINNVIAELAVFICIAYKDNRLIKKNPKRHTMNIKYFLSDFFFLSKYTTQM